MMNSLRFDLTGRRQSLIPATGSYHPEPWMYAVSIILSLNFHRTIRFSL